jgi:hypothetical protein
VALPLTLITKRQSSQKLFETLEKLDDAEDEAYSPQESLPQALLKSKTRKSSSRPSKQPKQPLGEEENQKKTKKQIPAGTQLEIALDF